MESPFDYYSSKEAIKEGKAQLENMHKKQHHDIGRESVSKTLGQVYPTNNDKGKSGRRTK